MAVNKVEVGGEAVIDLTADTVSENNLLAGATAHNAAGEPITGVVAVAPIDSELSETSENPVQNKVILAALNEKASSSHSHSVADITDFPEIPTEGGSYRIITGSFQGDGVNPRYVDIGATPIMVFLSAQRVQQTYVQNLLALKDSPVIYSSGTIFTLLEIVENGFNVRDVNITNFNTIHFGSNFIAICEN